MRARIVAQPALDFNPSNLKVTNQYFRKYRRISQLLDENPKIINLVHGDIGGLLEAAKDGKKGRPYQYATDTVLRILICQILEGLSLRGVVIRIDDSHYLRRFVRIDDGPMLDFTTLDKLKNAIRPTTWKEANRLLAKAAIKAESVTGNSLRLDTTLVETNIHWPTDSFLLWDSYRVLSGLIGKAREIDSDAVGKKRLRLRRVKRLYSQISRTASSKKAETKKRMTRQYKKLIEAVMGIIEWSVLVGESLEKGIKSERYAMLDDALAAVIVSEMKNFRDMGRRVVDQAQRRIFLGEKVPNDEKLFSIFEPHTELIKRGKQSRHIEFGHMIEIQQVESKFITDYTVFDKQPNERKLLVPAIKNHKELFGYYPQRATADKGYYEDMKTLQTLEKKVEIVAIAKKGKRSPEEIKREHAPGFKDAQRFRAGVEGSISFLKRILGLLRCLNKGWEHFSATVGMTVLAHNLLNLART